MTTHQLFAVGFATDDPDVIAGPDGFGTLGNIAVPAGAAVGLIDTVDDLMGLTFANLSPAAGDRVVVVGTVADGLPAYQVGFDFTVDADGVAHFSNAGHLAAAIAEARSA